MRRLVPLILILLANPAWAGREERADKADQVWQMDRMLTIRIHMSADRWRMMQPARASRLATAMAVVQHPTTRQAMEAAESPAGERPRGKPPVEGERRAPGLVGNEYAYVGATVTIDDKTLHDVGVRFKGQWSYSLAGASPRRPLKLNFDHFVPGQHFHGIQAMALASNALDPSQLRETLAYACFREAGVAAPRTCFALVYLTVDGVYDDELLGLYTAVEEVNKDFLHEHFDTARGLLIRPERTRNLAYFGNDWREYNRYNIQSAATPFAARRFMDFTRAINLAGDEEFCTEIATYFDGDEFLRFIAVNVLIVNLDGVLVNGHNYYIYVHPETGRLSFIPWDLHLSFGWNGQTLEEWAGLTIERPYRDSNRLVSRMMTVGWMRDAYREHLREFATGCFAPARMHARIDQLQEVVRKAEAIAKAQGKVLPVSMPVGNARARAELKPFVAARVQSVLDQLAGRVEGDPVGGRPSKPVIQLPKPVLSVRLPALPAPRPTTQPVIVAPKPEPVNVTQKPTTRPAIAATTRPAVAKPLPAPAVAPAAVAPKPTTRPAIAATTRPAVAKPSPAAQAPPPKVPAPVVPDKRNTRPFTPNPVAQLLLNNIDVDRDGQLTREEVADAAKHLFIAHGWMHRGPVDATSLAATLDHLGRLLDPFPPSTDDTAAPLDPLRPRPALTWARAIVQRADVNKTGQVTLEDLLAAANRMFDEADANHDGVLNGREIGAFLDQLVPRP
ncbi:MAG: CotH kinase family protein [Tepidisphaerales bacterium]